MKGYRVGLALVVALAGCEPVDEGAPAAAPQGMPQGAPGTPPPPPGPPPASEPAPPSANGETTYSSPEYTIGEDTDSYDDNDPSALKDFHAALDPNGSWVDDSTYGTVWVPSTAAVGADFTPYSTAGHWLYDTDWVWASDYPWGWAPFHYGRWVRVEGRGWAWIPGRAYRGAWVTWGVNDGYTYLGWAPMGPAFVWFGGMAIGWRGYVGPSWVYCPRGEVFSPGVGARVVTGAAAGPIAAGMHGYVSATPGVSGGPSPQRLGYNASQVPRPSASAAAGVAHAQAFARPSTGQTLGASNPSRVATPEANRAALSHATPATERPSITSTSHSVEGSAHAAAPSVAHGSVSAQGAAGAHTSVPAARSSGWHGAGGGGGGHHR